MEVRGVMSIYLGIDFGTSTNYITRWNEQSGEVKSVPNIDKRMYGKGDVFPNAIYYQQSGNQIIGKAALDLISVDPHNGVFGVKKKLVEENYIYHIASQSKNLMPVEIATNIFSSIKEIIQENNGGSPIDGAVISVPYSYGHRERMRIRYAAERAGIPVIDLIEEPVAAAISYGIFQYSSSMGHSKNIMVFDFGGGTLDITVFHYEKSRDGNVVIEVLNTEGIKNFGGQMIDDNLTNRLAEKAGIVFTDIADEKLRRNLQTEIRIKAIEMKEEHQYWVEEGGYFLDDIIQGWPISIEVSETEFENWVRADNLLGKIRESIEDALFDSGDKGLDYEDIDKVVLVGGSSNLQVVKDEIKKIFGKDPEVCDSIDIDKLVGYGAGLYCGIKASNNNNYKIIQKSSYAIGVKVGTKFVKFIEKNQVYGKVSDIQYMHLSDGRELRSIEIYQGNSQDITKCFLIGKIPLDSIGKSNTDKIGIRLGTDEYGMVQYQLYIGEELIKKGTLEQ